MYKGWHIHQSLSKPTTEYCAQVWERSKHTKKIDTLLNTSMRIVSGALKAIPTIWLATMTAISPPHLRKQKLTQNAHLQLKNLPDNIPIKKIIETAASTRLKSRKSFHRSLKTRFDIYEAWKEHQPKGENLVTDPTKPLPGFFTAS